MNARRGPAPGTPALVGPAVLAALLAAAAGSAGSAGAPPAPLAPYVEFLEQRAEDPVEYLLGLFDDHDLVIVCERFHPEVTQYELFSRLVRDPRFAERVGVVYTELGARDRQDALDAIMATAGLDREAVGRRLVPIFRDLGLHPFWDSTNFFDFLRDVYALNQSRPPDGRVRVRFVDLPIDWAGMTQDAYAAYRENEIPRRDRRMADAIIDAVEASDRAGGGQSKALIIMNYRHAFNDFEFADGTKGDNVGRYLFEAFPGRVANVLLNSLALLPGTTDFEVVSEPIQKGKWDAAFRVAGIERAGFDFAGSPFGRNPFDLFRFRPHSLSYQDVFDGFVFYLPLAEHRFESGIPGMFEDGFEAEARRRFAVTGRTVSDADFAAMVAADDEPLVERYDDPEAIEAMIATWIPDPGAEKPGQPRSP